MNARFLAPAHVAIAALAAILGACGSRIAVADAGLAADDAEAPDHAFSDGGSLEDAASDSGSVEPPRADVAPPRLDVEPPRVDVEPPRNDAPAPPVTPETCTSEAAVIGSLGGQAAVQGIAVDGRYIYLADAQNGAIRRMDLQGGVETLANSLAADRVVLNEGSLYWMNFDGVSTMSASGGTPTLLVAEQGLSGSGGGGFVLTSTHVYWVSRSAGTVSRTTRSGGDRSLLASGLNQPTSIAVDGTNAFVTTYAGDIVTVPVSGGIPAVYASGMRVPHAIVTHSTGLYWGNRAGNAIMRMPPGGGPPETFDTGQNPEVLAFADDALYWLSYSTGGYVKKVPLDGSPRTQIATGIILGKSLAVTAQCVYWVTSDGKVMHVKR